MMGFFHGQLQFVTLVRQAKNLQCQHMASVCVWNYYFVARFPIVSNTVKTLASLCIDLKVHKITISYTGDKPYQCDVSKKIFQRSRYLQAL